MSARQQFSALVEVDRDEQVAELVRLAANAEIGLTVYDREPCSCDRSRGPATHPAEGEESAAAPGGDACANCLQAHGPLDECALGVLAGVVRDRWEGLDDRPDITPAMLGEIGADHFWDLLCPAIDWLEDELRRAAP
ncbi:MAG TPA: hypothetical protein VGH58_01290 [Solirubrobacterales bacterium]